MIVPIKLSNYSIINQLTVNRNKKKSAL